MKSISTAFLFSALCFLFSPSVASANETPDIHWIWFGDDPAEANEVFFRKSFELPDSAEDADAAKAIMTVTCDNTVVVRLNGVVVARSNDWRQVDVADVSAHLKAGKNVLAVEGGRTDGSAGLALHLAVDLAGETLHITSDPTWKVATEAADEWTSVDFDDAGWQAAHSFGTMGVAPWGNVFATIPAPPDPANRAGLRDFHIADGFAVERVYTVPKGSQGSWVALALDDQGRIIASDQGDKGVFRITPAPLGGSEDQTKVEKLDTTVSQAQGILWAFDSLYLNSNNDDKPGIHRFTDTNGDGKFDKSEFILRLNTAGEHGPHAMLPTPDGEGIYVVNGNFVAPPADLAHSRVPSNWDEDLLLPRQWDARGHARGRLAPGGYIARIDPDGGNPELINTGYRNTYDFALNHHGDIFTFDSDMEWDLGMPWFRPTRLVHAVSGGEYGWRSGSGKWPDHFADSLPPVQDIGPGSPTGVLFGYGAKFPTAHQEAVYLLDWTYGTIWAVLLEQNGATYKATAVQEFLSAAPLPLTDAVIGADGAMYFAVGGRNADSFLYRIVYEGDKSTATAPTFELNDAQKTRRMLEALHHPDADDAVAKAWGYLGDEDRFIRYAARIAIEHQPVEEWREKALAESDPQALVTAMVALSRQGSPEDLDPVLSALHPLDISDPTVTANLESLRAYQLAMIRLGTPTDEWREKLLEKFDPLFPSGNERFDRDLIEILVFLESPTVIEKAMPFIIAAEPAEAPTDWPSLDALERNNHYGSSFQAWANTPTPLQALHFAFALRNMQYGWTLEQRQAYFTFINEVSKLPGGRSFPGFLENIRDEALENATPAEQHALADITGVNLDPPAEIEITPPEGPARQWQLDEALAAVENNLTDRDFDKGRNFYHATACATCHVFSGEGGAIGPDLTSVANTYSVRDMLHKLIDPNVGVSDQYAGSIVTKKDGSTVAGMVIETDPDKLIIYGPNPNVEAIEVPRDEVESVRPSPTSPMPPGLINPLNEDELADLIAYLLSRGNPEADYFKP